jgi:ABC-2 type transport system ATP-binding protein
MGIPDSTPSFSKIESAPSDGASPIDPASVVVQTFDLSKTYRTGFWMNQKVESLKKCTLSVAAGETFGLLGPNGAGKTTLLKTLLGIIRPTTGRGFLFGHPLGERQLKQRVGYLPENPYFYDYLTGWEYLDFTAGLFQLSRAVKQRRILELLDLVGLAQSAARKKQLRQYSKGMLQRIGMAQALMNDPELVFLDEPMSGLDPLGRYQIREIILSLKAQGKTVFFNSHILSDVEAICDRVAILAQGSLICVGSLDEILGNTCEYHVKGRGSTSDFLNLWLTQWEHQGSYWQGLLSQPLPTFLTELAATQGEVLSVNLARPSLEEFFIEQLRQRGIRSSS